MFAFLNVKANSKEIYIEIYFPSLFFQKNADVSIFLQIYGQLSRKKYARLLLFFFVESKGGGEHSATPGTFCVSRSSNEK